MLAAVAYGPSSTCTARPSSALVVARWQARGQHVLKSRAGTIEQQDLARATVRGRIQQFAQGLEHELQWTPQRDQLEQPLFTREQSFGAPLIVDIGEQEIPGADIARRVALRKAAHAKPTIVAVATPHTGFDVIGTAVGHHAVPRGQHVRQIFRVDDVADLPTFDLLDRRAEILSSPAIDAGPRRPA